MRPQLSVWGGAWGFGVGAPFSGWYLSSNRVNRASRRACGASSSQSIPGSTSGRVNTEYPMQLKGAELDGRNTLVMPATPWRTLSGPFRRWVSLGLAAGLVTVASAVSTQMISGAPAGAIPAGVGAQVAQCPGGTLTPHGPISINTDADWSAAHGVTSGNGSQNAPYVIKCLSITAADSVTLAGIDVAPAAANVSYTISNVRVTEPSTASFGIQLAGSSSGVATLANDSISGPGTSNGMTGINASLGTLAITQNLVSNTRIGITATGAAGQPSLLNLNGNYGTNAGTQCEKVTNGTSSGDSCVGNSATGFDLTAAKATSDTANDNGGIGFLSNNDVKVTASTADGNATGISFNGNFNVALNNTVENNNGVGIDLSSSDGGTVQNNTIEHNGAVGISDNPTNGSGSVVYGNSIIGNHVGHNPYGIIFFGPAPGNLVQGTDWTDGAQSIADLSDQNTVVDAGSTKHAAAGQTVLLSDWVARVTLGPDNTVSSPVTGTVGTLQPATVTGITWDFPDGLGGTVCPRQSVTDPSNGHGPPPQVTCNYPTAGAYTAVLTVTGMDQAGPFTLTDSVPVLIAAKVAGPAPTMCGAYGPSGLSAGTDWANLGGDGTGRTFCTPTSGITPANVNQMVPQWHFPTPSAVTASPAVSTVNGTKMVFDGDFNGNLYGLNAGSGLQIWDTCIVPGAPDPAPLCDPATPGNTANQVDYGAIVASPAVATVGGTQRVFEAATYYLSSLDAATGKINWTFNASGDSGVPNYEIEGSPMVVTAPPTVTFPTGEQLVLFSMDCNAYCAKPGGMYALDATNGHLVWFFDPVTGANFVPVNATTLSFAPTDTGPPTAGVGACGGVWASQTVDLKLGLVLGATADCPQEPMSSLYFEAVFALNLANGKPVWHYQPRQKDVDDLDFGDTPNLYSINSASGPEDVLGFGSKDGSYTLMDAATGTVLWNDKLILGGGDGGFFNAATDGTQVYLTAGPGALGSTTVSAADDAKKGREWAIDAATGNVNWVQTLGVPTFAQHAVIPGVYFLSSLDGAVHALATSTGAPLAVLPTGGAISSGSAVVGNQLFVGAGTGSTFRGAVGTCLDPTGLTCAQIPAAPTPIPITEYGQGVWAYCLGSDAVCQTSRATSLKEATTLTYNGATTGDFGDPATVSATVTSAAAVPIPNENVTFTMAAESCVGISGANGQASCQITPADSAGAYTVSTTFGGDTTFQPSVDTKSFSVTTERATLTYTGATTATDRGPVTLSGVLEEDGTTPMKGEAVNFTLGTGSTAQFCAAGTNANGVASCTISSVSQPVGPDPVSASYGGNSFHASASAGASVAIAPASNSPSPPTPYVPGKGYWMVASDGGIFSFGSAQFYGSMGNKTLNKPMVGMAPTAAGKGYWTDASDGGVFSFGDAQFHGSMGGTTLNKPMVGMASTPDGGGYWMDASDGGIFSFGNAQFYGSMGNKTLNAPMVGMATYAK